jgi:hypothetical protein
VIVVISSSYVIYSKRLETNIMINGENKNSDIVLYIY